MNRNKFHLIRNMAVTLLACMGIVSCSQDESVDMQGDLPPGQYPMELTAGGMAVATPTTRATVDNDWDGVNTVAVQVGGEVKKYTVTPTDSEKKYAKLTSSNPFYWQSATEPIDITAWHPYSTAYPEMWTVKADQGELANYQASDLIRGELLNLAFADRNNAEKNKITFEHQTAKVVINLTAPDGFSLDDASVQLQNIVGVENGSTTIMPYQPDNENQTYFALLNRQTIAKGETFIQVTANNTKFYYKPEVEKTLEAGMVYTYYISVQVKGLSVSVEESMSWGKDGATGEGSVTLPTEINLSDKPIEIKDNRNYIITGDGTQTVTIDGNAHVTFSDVTITTTEGAPIHVTDGSPTLHFNGKNTLNCQAEYWGGITVENSANLTLIGDTNDAALAITNNQNETVGIGTTVKDRENPGSTCGNITISNLYLTINSSMGSGIGATHHSVCGDIEITDCKLDIKTTNNAACIGASCGKNAAKSQCGNITLRDCEIVHLHAGYVPSYNYYPASIGCSTGNAHCGDINIYLHETYASIDDFLMYLKVDGDVDKVGVGQEALDRPSIGTVTWYDHNEVKIGEGTRK